MMTIEGPSQSEKSYWIYHNLKDIEKLIKPTPRKIVYLHDTSFQKFHDQIKRVVA